MVKAAETGGSVINCPFGSVSYFALGVRLRFFVALASVAIYLTSRKAAFAATGDNPLASVRLRSYRSCGLYLGANSGFVCVKILTEQSGQFRRSGIVVF